MLMYSRRISRLLPLPLDALDIPDAPDALDALDTLVRTSLRGSSFFRQPALARRTPRRQPCRCL